MRAKSPTTILFQSSATRRIVLPASESSRMSLPERSSVWSLFSSRKLIGFLARPNKADLTTLQSLMADGKITPVIDRHYPLSDIRAAFAIWKKATRAER